FDGEKEPKVPDRKLNAETLTGIDSNNNGIRDDIDIWINRTAYDQNETKAMRQFSKTRQEWLKNCESNSTPSQSVLFETRKAEVCLSMLSDYKRNERNYAQSKLELLIFNTDARKKCFVTLSKAPILKLEE